MKQHLLFQKKLHAKTFSFKKLSRDTLKIVVRSSKTKSDEYKKLKIYVYFNFFFPLNFKM